MAVIIHQGLDRVLRGLCSAWGRVAGMGQRKPTGALNPRRAASSARGGAPRVPSLLGPSWAHKAPGSCPSCRLGLLSAFESVSSPRLCELSFKPEMGSLALLRGLKERDTCVSEWPLPLWALALGTARKRISLKSGARGPRWSQGTPGMQSRPGTQRPPAQPGPSLASSSVPSQTGGALWPLGIDLPSIPAWRRGGSPASLVHCPGRGGALNLMGLVPQSG